jgi:hypothetical protein
VAEVGKRADEYAQTTKAIAEHVGRVHGHEMKQLVLKGEESKFKEPEYPDAKTSGDIERDRAIWSKQYDMFVLKKEEKYKEQKAKVFSLVIGQCEKAVKNHVENDSGYEKAENENDVVALLQMIKKNVAYNANVRKYPAEQPGRVWLQYIKRTLKTSRTTIKDLPVWLNWWRVFTVQLLRKRLPKEIPIITRIRVTLWTSKGENCLHICS